MTAASQLRPLAAIACDAVLKAIVPARLRNPAEQSLPKLLLRQHEEFVRGDNPRGCEFVSPQREVVRFSGCVRSTRLFLTVAAQPNPIRHLLPLKTSI